MTTRAASVSVTHSLGCIGEALATIRRNPLRSGLAGLALATAVATTAVVQTGLDGLARTARETSARAFGADAFVLARVASGALNRRELAVRLDRNPAITRSDARFLDALSDGRVRYAATAQRTADVNADSRSFENAAINGTQASLLDIRDIVVDRGRFFSPQEERTGALVVVAGRAVTDELFPDGEPLGRTVRLGGRAFRVIGLQARQGTTGGVSLDRYIWMPLIAYERTFGVAASLQIFAKAAGTATTVSAEDRARTTMRARRRLAPGRPDTFDLITPDASRSFVAEITERIGAAGPPISAMALLAAIIVVSNTTLVSVAQRTREIGLRRALGATRRTILIETLLEATVVAVGGGVVGLAVAAALLWAASTSLAIPLALDIETVVTSLTAATLSGLLAGLYPARRAAALDVVTALRHE